MMFKKALQIIAPSVIGIIAGFIIATLVFGIQVASKAIIPLLFGICCGYIASLYFATKKDNDGNK